MVHIFENSAGLAAEWLAGRSQPTNLVHRATVRGPVSYRDADQKG